MRSPIPLNPLNVARLPPRASPRRPISAIPLAIRAALGLSPSFMPSMIPAAMANTFLTAPIWDWSKFYEPRILECLQGKFKAKHYWEGANTGVVALAPLTEHVVPRAKEIVEQEMEKLKSGTFDVFYGPIKDQNGTIRIQEGESMTDYAMLNEFDWYVEGVYIDE